MGLHGLWGDDEAAMNDQELISRMRDLLTVLKLADEVKLEGEIRGKIQVVVEEYLKAWLPK